MSKTPAKEYKDLTGKKMHFAFCAANRVMPKINETLRKQFTTSTTTDACVHVRCVYVCVCGGGEGCVRSCLSLCVCVRERERERERQRERERGRQRERER